MRKNQDTMKDEDKDVYYVKHMLQLQENINQCIHPEWRTQNYPWYRAIWTECAELMDHYGWKWWKKSDSDLTQIHLEIVDIWHFGLSDCLQFSEDENAIAHALKQVCSVSSFNKESTVGFLGSVEGLALACLSLNRFPLQEFSNLLQKSNLDLLTLYRLYIGKNVLNQFRQDFGYKSGTYRKLWQGKEDNQHLAEVISTLDPSEERFMQNIYRGLEARYAQPEATQEA